MENEMKLIIALCATLFLVACGSNPASPAEQGNVCYRVYSNDGGELEEFFYLLNTAEFVHVYNPPTPLDYEIFVDIAPGNAYRMGCLPTTQNQGIIRLEVLIDGVSVATEYCTEPEYYNVSGIVPE
jgi:hypothetical protein